MATLNIKTVYQDDKTIDSSIELADGVVVDDISDDNVIGYAEWLCKTPIKAVFRGEKQIYPRPQITAVEEKFEPSVIDKHFSNVELVTHLSSETKYVWSVMDVCGNQTGSLTHHRNQNQWDIYVDNFPSQKKYYSTNIPIRTLPEFVSNITGTGLVLFNIAGDVK